MGGLEQQTVVSATISEHAFGQLVSERARYLLSVANHLPKHQLASGIFTRPLLGRLLLQSLEIQEMIDAYGAKNNKHWQRFRHLVTTVKVFAGVGYELLHIQHTLPNYQLLEDTQELSERTLDALALISYILLRACTEMTAAAQSHNLYIPPDTTAPGTYDETLPPGRLLHDVETRKVENVYETVTLLATAFLNLAQEARILTTIQMPNTEACACFVSDKVNQESLHRLYEKYHNLQSLYDTYVSDTEAETLDHDLVVLRGHISLSMHLLSVAATLAQYYEQHVRTSGCRHSTALGIVEPQELLHVMIDYAIGYAVCYTTSARTLCQDMLRRYTEIDQIDVSIPVYRGFHVRPSTLVATIVNHYGTEVHMQLDGETVNAAVPLEIFRINEKINAEKRRLLAQQVSALSNVRADALSGSIRHDLHSAILHLAQQGMIVIYQQPLELTDQAGAEEELFLKCLTDEIRRLLAEAKLDIHTDMTVRFTGDRRVLEDLKLLAECGYGEDRFGNNIPLPEKLVYLRC
ncbi:HPr family phosphocarrier protein [Planctomycetota bacterium]